MLGGLVVLQRRRVQHIILEAFSEGISQDPSAAEGGGDLCRSISSSP